MRKSLKDLGPEDVGFLNFMAFVMPVAAVLLYTMAHFSGGLEVDAGVKQLFIGATVWIAVFGFIIFKFFAHKAKKGKS